MTQRSILAKPNPIVVVKAGSSVTVKGVDGDRITASTTDSWGLKVERRSEAEFARARAAIGSWVLFDVRFKKPAFQSDPEELIEVQLGGSGEVLVPFGSYLKVYAARNIDVQGIHGRVDAYAGGKLCLVEVNGLGSASAGQAMDLDCETILSDRIEINAGGDIRFRIRELDSAYLRVKDLGGYWEARIGTGLKSIYLKCGGDLTLVTEKQVDPLPPDFVLGKIEKPL